MIYIVTISLDEVSVVRARVTTIKHKVHVSAGSPAQAAGFAMDILDPAYKITEATRATVRTLSNKKGRQTLYFDLLVGNGQKWIATRNQGEDITGDAVYGVQATVDNVEELTELSAIVAGSSQQGAQFAAGVISPFFDIDITEIDIYAGDPVYSPFLLRKNIFWATYQMVVGEGPMRVATSVFPEKGKGES